MTQINIKNIPIGCLYNSISKLEAPKISLISQVATERNETLNRLCLSKSLWKNLYINHFPTFEFQTSQKNNDVDWLTRYAKRYAIATNIKNNKPKVKSFLNDDVSKIRTLTNAFAFNTPKDITLVVYDYLDNECKYEESSKFDIKNNDFIFLNDHKMVSVGDSVALFDLNQKSEILRSNSIDYRFLRPNMSGGPIESHVQSISESSFAILWNKNGTVYDTRENMFSRRCFFICEDNIIATANDGSILYLATPSSVTAYDTRAARGLVLWKKFYRNDNSTFCDFNIKSNRALLGNRIIDLQLGQSIAFYDPSSSDNTIRGAGRRHGSQNADMPINGAIVDDKFAAFGFEKRSVVLFDYSQTSQQNFGDDDTNAAHAGKTISTFDFPDGGIKSISASYINDVIAVAADYSIKILKVPKKSDEKLTDIRTVSTGSVGARKRGEIGSIKQVVFDGERLITNMGTFVRVYDFYTGKKAKK